MKMYHYTESGLRNVWLCNGYTVHQTPYGRGTAIEDIAGLHRVLSHTLVMKPGKLSGAEIRFLRKEMEMSQASLALSLGVNAQTLATWEKGKAKIPGPADKMLRVLTSGHYTNNVQVRKLVDTLNNLDVAEHDGKLMFEEQDRKWKLAA
jgi:DNA-binding transcriptional regulator YiaG